MLKEKDKDQIIKFISMLWHDDRESNYFICNCVRGGMKSYRTSIEEFNFNQIKEIDCYISLNGFAGHHRRIKECRQINGIVFDLDYHEKTASEYLDWIKNRTLNLINEAVSDRNLYEPNIITDTGRGLQLLYIFENSISYYCKNGNVNEKAIYAYKKIRENIESSLNNILSSETETLVIDKNVFDISRIIRLPGTINTKTGTKATIVHINEDYYFFDDFHAKKEKSSHKKKSGEKKFKSYSLCNKTILNQTRLDEMEKLQLLRKDNCEGYRNYMTFIYYNSAVQIYDQKTAKEKTYEFCGRFGKSNSSFSDTQIKAIIRGIDKNSTELFNGHYVITKEWIIEKLAITDEEADTVGLSKKLNSRKIKKKENLKRKNERDLKILELADKNVKHNDIAKSVGVSLRTVQNVLKKNGRTREYTSIVKVQKSAS